MGRKTLMHSELLAQIVLSVFLNLSVCSSLAASDPLLPIWMSLIPSSSFWFSVMSPPDASACRTATCSSSLFPGSIGTSPAPRSTRALFLFHLLCLSGSVFVCIHPCFFRQGSLNDRYDPLSAVVIMWLCRSSMRCKCRTAWTTSSVSVSFDVHRRNVESSRLNLWRSFNHNPWQWGPAPSLSAVTFFVNFNSGATICHGVPHKPSQFVDSQESLSVCLVQLVPRTTPFLVIHKIAPVRS